MSKSAAAIEGAGKRRRAGNVCGKPIAAGQMAIREPTEQAPPSVIAAAMTRAVGSGA